MPGLPDADDYDDALRQFRWNIPARYNIGVDLCDRWAARDPARLAILHVQPDGRDETHHLRLAARNVEPSRQCAARARRRARRPRRDLSAAGAGSRGRAYRDLQARRGGAADRDAVRARCAVLSACRIPAPRRCITNAQGLAKLADIRGEAPDLTCVLSIDGAGDGALRLRRPNWRAPRRTSRRSIPPPTIRR